MESRIKFSRVISVIISGENEIKDLRMTFRVERLILDSYATLRIEIYNTIIANERLSGSSALRGESISIDAGYKGNVSTLFSGVIQNVQKEKRGSDIITTIFANDSPFTREVVVSRSYRNKTSIVSLISDIAFEAGIDIAEFSIKSRNIKGSVSYVKRFSRIMDSLSKANEFTWFIFNREMYLYDNDAANSSKSTLEISASTGLLETPVLTQKGVNVKMLLEPSVRPMDTYEVQAGGLVFAQGNLELTRLVSRGNGVQKALSVVHTGDTHGNTWITEIEGESKA